MIPFSNLDILAFLWYTLFWASFSYIVDHSPLRHNNLSHLMNGHRLRWMQRMAPRDFRMIDTSIITGLQNGTAFFASTSLIAIGAGFALLNATDLAIKIASDLPFPVPTNPEQWEIKALMLTGVYVYAFFKFGWAYRLFNYTSILVGAFPYPGETSDENMKIAVEQAAEMNALAGHNFNLGLRAFFFSAPLFGWFIHPILFMLTTAVVTLVLARRQFFSRSQHLAKTLLP